MKRFTEAEKWKDGWFRKLKPVHKCLWFYLLDNCDHAGVIDPDWELVTFQIGSKVSEADLDSFEKQVVILPNGKLWIHGFIRFQYGNLSRECKPHAPVFAAMDRSGIDFDLISKGIEGYSKVIEGYRVGSQSLQDKDKEKEKDKEQDKIAERPVGNAAQTAIPDSLKTPAFEAAWSDWKKHRQEKRCPLKAGSQAEKMQLKNLEEMGELRAIASIRHSISNDWQGLFEPKEQEAGRFRTELLPDIYREV